MKIEGSELKRLHEHLHFSRRDLAERLDVQESAIMGWEDDVFTIPQMAILAIAYLEIKEKKRNLPPRTPDMIIR